MNTVIRPADLESDRELIIDTLFRYLTPLSNGSRFDWLYRNNPHGQARVWIAIDKENGAMVGMASAFPRRMYVGGREELGWVLGDFCINDRYRSLGPALLLQQACLAEVDARAITFCYDFPSPGMMAVYNRLRINPFGQMMRLAKPLRVDRKVRKVVKSPAISFLMSSAGNLLLRLSERKSDQNLNLTISPQEGNCGGEFSELAKKISSRYGVCTHRSAEYLNWRYLSHPTCRYKLLTARRDNLLLAYAVFSHAGEDALLEDLFGVEEPVVIKSLLGALVTLLRRRGVVTVSASMLESHPWIPLLYDAGFKSRETCPVVVYEPSQVRIFEGAKWCLMQGDRDS